jgi:two-component SAPR family response regulator
VTDRRPKTKMRGDAKGTSERLEAIRIRLLGGFEVTLGARSIEEGAWRLRKAANLLKLLALAAANRLHPEQVMDTLWPELGISAASNNLRQTVHSARRTLDPTMGSLYLASRDESLVLCPERSLWVDVDAFEEAARPVCHATSMPIGGSSRLETRTTLIHAHSTTPEIVAPSLCSVTHPEG